MDPRRISVRGSPERAGPEARGDQVLGMTAKVCADSVAAVRERLAGTLEGLGFAVTTPRESELVATKVEVASGRDSGRRSSQAPFPLPFSSNLPFNARP